MNPIRRAVIDIGTNSVKLLVADVAGRDVQPVWEGSRQTRLGRGFYEAHQLQPEAILHTAQAVAAFAAAARKCKAVSIRAIATSAVRDAVNPGELTSAVGQASGLEVEIISGEQEADWAFLGVISNPELARQPVLIVDVGGGSAQFIVGGVARRRFRHSFPLGTVRLMETIPHSDPPKPRELAACRRWLTIFFSQEVSPKLMAVLRRQARLNPDRRRPRAASQQRVQLVGTGGTAAILARIEARLDRFDRERIEATRLSLDRVRAFMKQLWGTSLAERKEIVGLPKKRADVILTGVTIYEAVMAELGFDEFRVSTRGLRFAAVMDGA